MIEKVQRHWRFERRGSNILTFISSVFKIFTEFLHIKGSSEIIKSKLFILKMKILLPKEEREMSHPRPYWIICWQI